MYLNGKVSISKAQNKGLHDVVDGDPLNIFIVCFCNWNAFLLPDEFFQNMIPYSITE